MLVAEYAQATQRGRVIGAVQSAWSIGYAGVLIANTLAFSLAPPELAWRIMFWLGAVDPVKVEASRQSGKPLPSLHSSLFAPLPEPTLRTGIKAMTGVVLELMKK